MTFENLNFTLSSSLHSVLSFFISLELEIEFDHSIIIQFFFQTFLAATTTTAVRLGQRHRHRAGFAAHSEGRDTRNIRKLTFI